MRSTPSDNVEYVEDVVTMAFSVKKYNPRKLALDLWKNYPEETKTLLANLTQTQHTRKVPKLLQGD